MRLPSIVFSNTLLTKRVVLAKYTGMMSCNVIGSSVLIGVLIGATCDAGIGRADGCFYV
jgi:hypothetical protein